MEILTSKNNQKIKELFKLKQKKYRQKSNTFLIEGYNLVKEAIKAGIVLNIYESSDNPKYKNSILVSYEIIKHLSFSETPQKIVAHCKNPVVKKKMEKILFLNKVQDPGNVGTIIRLAKAFGFDTVVTEYFDFFNQKVIRASQGSLFEINLIEIKNDTNFLSSLKKQGFKIYSTILDFEAKKLSEIIFPKSKLIIVLGNEGHGISNEIIKISNEKVYIPIEFESLNVASCAAILLNKIYNG
ncbi:TrmH family RNA methyltransferase [Mycoplasmopsis cricetuli]|uniref:TrmH family RNA methyltransferase n=1 Tax=Mycoplasmopsis cricetuli TaxID=171283 RepID=UPI00046E8687|nr:RNA methyltransferase [Mycoplasmopsis cricetuli]